MMVLKCYVKVMMEDTIEKMRDSATFKVSAEVYNQVKDVLLAEGKRVL